MKTLQPTRSGFTLIELLVVIAIIAILAGLILNVAGNIQLKGARTRAAAEIAAMSAALESYKADYGDYPASDSSAISPATLTNPVSNNNLLAALAPSSGKAYFQFPSRMLSTNTSTNITDPFGNPYGYYYASTTTNGVTVKAGNKNGVGFFDLWSTSGNATNTNLWTTNW